MGKKQVSFMCTAFRDGFQSAYGARVLTKDFLPAVEAARDAGITRFEAGGGARFQALYFYCNEDAFDMMDAFRATVGPEANLQTLSRGVNVVGLESQSSDVIKAHADLFAKHGITTIRNFDALNDMDNLDYSGRCITDAGMKHQVSVTMMELPPGCEGSHDPEYYESVLRRILDAEIPFDSVCFKDASGTSTPAKVHETIKRARRMLPGDTHIHFHSHETSGTGVLCYKAALEAGANGVDLSLAPASGGTCQPDVVVMWHALRGTDYYLDVDIDKVLKAEGVFKDCMKDYFLPPEAMAVEPTLPWSPMPGGALTANTQMLRDNNIMDRYPEIIAAMGDAVRKGGFGTSVTPVSQFYFQQAFNNVIFGPWKKIADGYGKMVLGYFGRTPVEPDPEVVAIAAEQLGLEPTTETPRSLNDKDPAKGLGPAAERLRQEGLPVTDENTFIAATCRDKGIAFLKGEAKLGIRYAEKTADQNSAQSQSPVSYNVSVGKRTYSVTMEGNQAVVNGKAYPVEVRESTTGAQSSGQASPSGNGEPVPAPIPGIVMSMAVTPGDHVRSGDTLLVLEAMKMEVEVNSPVNGVVCSVDVSVGDQVAAEQPLVYVEKGGADE